MEKTKGRELDKIAKVYIIRRMLRRYDRRLGMLGTVPQKTR